MSMNKWRELVSEKEEVEKQNASILAAIKNNKIKEELGLLSGEKLFKPITSRLDTIQEGAAPKEEKEEVPDYGMDEFDLINPFDGDFNPDAETPTPTHQHHHQHHHHHHHHHRYRLWLKRKKRN